MCTVTFIPVGKTHFFTSSRDEHSSRMPASLPAIYETMGTRVMYPKDPQGGGTWIAVNESGYVAVLLNGAIRAHHSEPPYRKSRGMVVLDLIAEKSPADAFEAMNFEGIEPFTIILFIDGNLFCGKWDGRMKWMETLNAKKPQIWCSVTLYDQSAIQQKESWFRRWINEIPYPGTLDIIRFHQRGSVGESSDHLLVKRSEQLFTDSISSIRLTSDEANFRYLNLKNGETAESSILLQKTVPVQT